MGLCSSTPSASEKYEMHARNARDQAALQNSAAHASHAAASQTSQQSKQSGQVENTADGQNANVGVRRTFSNYKTFEDWEEAMRKSGVYEDLHCIIGIDFTASNRWTGKRTNQGRSLHDTTSVTGASPYSLVIEQSAHALHCDLDTKFPLYIFGSEQCKPDGYYLLGECTGVPHVVGAYKQALATQTLSGPTSFAPLIRRACADVEASGRYHVLLIITDGEITKGHERDNMNAIKEASNYPLSICVIGIGDGPFGLLEDFDDNVHAIGSRFDNFQFVNWSNVLHVEDVNTPISQEALVQAFMEVPKQYEAIKHHLGYVTGQKWVKKRE